MTPSRVRPGGRRGPAADPRRLRLLPDPEIERPYRGAPQPLSGEGTAEIQKMITGNRLTEKHRIS